MAESSRQESRVWAAYCPSSMCTTSASCRKSSVIARRTLVMCTATNERFSTSTLRLSEPGANAAGIIEPDMVVPQMGTQHLRQSLVGRTPPCQIVPGRHAD